ncbi:S41 family peptidase [Butyrivibrio sp. MC2013]|uniref:S41 family peptidase n=1 Tax=Butyrivibrio sp. MC2013 TaxID=1280686 RepID=UPI00040AA293|nr:S41 family peptidase [Butyrivibrio sp. MC2013]
MRRKIFILCLLLSALGIFACANAGYTEDFARKNAFISESADFENTSIYLEDYDQFWQVLEDYYPFLPLLRNMDIDVEDIKKSYREQVTKIDSAEGLKVILDQVTRQLGNYAHLRLVNYDDIKLYQGLEEEGDFSSKRWCEVLLNEKTLALFKDESESEEPIDKNGSSNFRFVSHKYLDDYDAVYIRIDSFTHSSVMSDSCLMEYCLKGHEDCENIIFDITSNGGGDASYWFDNIVAPLGGEYSYHQELYFIDSPLYREFYDNGSGSFEHLNMDYSERKKIEEITGIDDLSIKSNVDFKFYGENYGNDIIENHAKKWLLVSEDTYSSADMFTDFCKQTGWATVVGRRTGGDGVCDPVVVMLDNTGICIRFTLAVRLNDKGLVNNLYGTVPDIISKKNEKPLDTVLRLIKEGRK